MTMARAQAAEDELADVLAQRGSLDARGKELLRAQAEELGRERAKNENLEATCAALREQLAGSFCAPKRPASLCALFHALCAFVVRLRL